jgi:hypothetical protein
MNEDRVESMRQFIAESLREGLKGFVFDPPGREKLVERVTKLVDTFAAEVAKERFDEISVNVEAQDDGRMVATLTGPADLMALLVPELGASGDSE